MCIFLLATDAMAEISSRPLVIFSDRSPLVPPIKRPDAKALAQNPLMRVLNGRLSLSPGDKQLGAHGRQSKLSSFFKSSPGCCDAPKSSPGCGDAPPVSVSVGAKRPRSPPTHKPVVADAPPALPPGVVLLRGFLSLEQQHALLLAADDVTEATPFTIPQVRHPFTGKPAFGNFYITQAGRIWVGTKGSYADVGAADAVVRNVASGEDVAVPSVPAAVLECGRAAVAEALRQSPGVFEDPEWAHPERFTALFNYYTSWGSISVHSDSSEPSLKAEPPRYWPVVSLSVGDSAVFTLYPESRRIVGGRMEDGEGVSVQLRSGDALCFGGPARLMRHSVKEVLEVGADKGGGAARPPGLRMVPGRLNITLRQL